jgi:hypothetical protein
VGTLGKTTAGSSSSTSTANRTVVNSYTAGETGTVLTGHARMSTSSGSPTARVVVYADSSGAPGALLGISDALSITNTSLALLNFTFSTGNQPSIVSGNDYWIGMAWPATGGPTISWGRDTTASVTTTITSDAPNPFGTPGTALAGPVDGYVDVTVSGGGGGGTTPTVRSSSVGGTVAGATNTVASVAITKPTGLAAGDYMLAWVSAAADSTSMTAPSGWSSLTSQASDQANNIPISTLYGKVANSTDAAAANFTFTSTPYTSSTAGISVVLAAITTGTYDTTTPVTTGGWTTVVRGSAGSGQTTQTVASMTGVNHGLWLPLFSCDTNNNAETYPSSSGSATLVAQRQDQYSLVGMYQQALSAAGATGSLTVTPSGTNTSNGIATVGALVNPGAAATTDTTDFFMSQFV